MNYDQRNREAGVCQFGQLFVYRKRDVTLKITNYEVAIEVLQIKLAGRYYQLANGRDIAYLVGYNWQIS